MTRDEYAAAWSRLHGGYDLSRASPPVRVWVHTAYGMGNRLVAWRVGPSAVTTAGLIVSVLVPVAVLGSRWGLLLGVLLVLVAAVADGLDGAVAVISGRVSRFGYVYDSVADRVAELAWLVAFWLAGVPGWLVVAAGAVSWLQEYARARATAAGMTEIGVVTVAERPTRVLASLFGLLSGFFVTWGLGLAVAIWALLGLVGLGQIGLTIRRELDR
ncbi:CDP-alcohol phosphatidyltransferase family protein [Actinoplanes sp. TBRC 11911]|uniref:CDP-alcohol phosphatidyltransferase family protein n=1 Tax=Actinoplanes sp. TBRC 11911 TaxID=2729386 RepID=UPI00145CAEB9|nr:CDP-alcohol phosphatidyltransferase family protein [Actinoplanes sp. TBRC 11911]NMO53127.1 CDP-alcohol phosphatidyltransferase family protein [Actinoplanes sp. TBRC 11911]